MTNKEKSFSVEFHGFDNQSVIDQLSEILVPIIKSIMRLTDISLLEGITFSINSENYLSKIKFFDDRLCSTRDEGVGVAMTIPKIDGSWERNYIVINCEYLGLENLLKEFKEISTEENIRKTILRITHLLFHEMCHVMNNKMIIDRYPILSLRERFPNELQMMKHAITHTCWDEFHVCSVANQVGEDQEENYKQVLLSAMNNFEYKRDEIFKDYLLEHTSPDAYENLFNKTMSLIYSLFKYCGYYLGDLITKENNKISDTFLDHNLFWLLDELNSVLSYLHIGVKNDSINEQDFFKIGELAEKFSRVNGLVVEETENQNLFVNLSIPTQKRILYA